jgi:hypothetical protein
MLLARLALAIALCTPAAAWTEQQPVVAPIASIKQLHQAFIIPASDALFRAESVAPASAAAYAPYTTRR